MYWAISDVHGMYHTLLRLIASVEDLDPAPKFIFVGDFPDRGLHSKRAVDLAIKLLEEGHFAVRGNHDDVLDWICNGSCKSDLTEMLRGEVDAANVLNWWMQNGLNSALNSYGIDTMRMRYAELPYEWEAILDDIRDSIPQSHKDFYRDLPLSWENHSHFVVHAYVDPSIVFTRFGVKSVLSKQDKIMECLWSRFSQSFVAKGGETNWDKIGVFGHTPTSYYGDMDAIKQGKIRLIDTGAVFGNKMTAYCLETDSFYSVDRVEDDLRR
jgi:serine/threonine protein phosphatase 1